MGVDHSLSLFSTVENLTAGLEHLVALETSEIGGGDHHWDIPNKPVRQMIAEIAEFRTRIETTEDEVLGESNLSKCAFRLGKSIATLSFTPWTQRIYDFTRSGRYWMTILEFPMRKNQDFIPFDYPHLALLKEVVAAIRPVYAGLEGELNPTPSSYSLATNWMFRGTAARTTPLEEPPWSLTIPVVLGGSLATEVRRVFDFCSPQSGLFRCEPQGEDLFWLFQPGTQAEWDRYRWEMWGKLYKRKVVGKKHEAAMLKLSEVLAKIPCSALEEPN